MNARPNCVEAWFGDAYSQLDPRIRRLHRAGGVLTGACQVSMATGLRGLLGHLLAWRLGVPRAGLHQLQITVCVEENALVWKRRFDDGSEFASVFVPVGRYPGGHWIESSSAMRVVLGVELSNGGWRWRQRELGLGSLRIPDWLAPKVEAGKEIQGEHYAFSVAVSVPVFGVVLSYGGKLDPAMP